MAKLATWFSDAHRMGFSALTLSVLPACCMPIRQVTQGGGRRQERRKRLLSDYCGTGRELADFDLKVIIIPFLQKKERVEFIN